MDTPTFHEFLATVCKRPIMYVGSSDFRLVAAFLDGYSSAIFMLRPEIKDGLGNDFREWLVIRLDSCVRSSWQEIIVREHPEADPFEVLPRLYGEYVRDRSEGKLPAMLKQFQSLGWGRDRVCWCELTGEEREQWRPGYRRP